MPLTAELAEAAMEQYSNEIDRYIKLAGACSEICEEIVESLAVPATVKFRAKSPESFRDKLLRYVQQGTESKIEEVTSERDCLLVVGDLAGVRVSTYVDSDRERVVAAIKQRFLGPNGPDVVVEVMNKASGYRATHCQVRLLREVIERHPELSNVANTSAEIQVSSMLAHVWNEIEHDLRYKDSVDWGSDATLRNAWLNEFAKHVGQADGVVGQLLLLKSRRIAEAFAEDVIAHVGDTYAEEGDRLRETLALAIRLGYDTVADIDDLLSDHQVEAIRASIEDILRENISVLDRNFGGTLADHLLAALLAREGLVLRPLLGDPSYSLEIDILSLAANYGLLPN